MRSLKSRLKKLISIPYQLAHELHKLLYITGILKAQRLNVPVISIGNISFGGTGKTPFTIYLSQRLAEIFNKKTCILTRAYKSEIPETHLPIIIHNDNVKDFLNSQYVQGGKDAGYFFIGDEPTIMLETVKNDPKISIAIGSDRYAAAKKAILEVKPDFFILDDAQQHLKIQKDFKIILVNVNEKGYYREFKKVLKKADCIIYSKVDNNWLLQEENQNKIALLYKIKLSKDLDRNKSVTAFSGLADNKYFFKLLEDNLKNQYFHKNFNTMEFSDHHNYSIDEIESLIKSDENLICTTKDFVKIPEEYKEYFIEASLDLKVINEDLLLSQVKKSTDGLSITNLTT